MDNASIIFVTGASRSGTTMLNRILGRHSCIYGLQELHFFGDLWTPGIRTNNSSIENLESMAAHLFARQKRGIFDTKPRREDFEKGIRLVSSLDSKEKNPLELFKKFVRTIASEQNKIIASEHTPRNIFYAKALLQILPSALFLNIVRDPRAVMASQKMRWKRRTRGGEIPWKETFRVWFNYHPFTVCRLWQKAVSTALSLSNHEQFLIVRFEDLIHQPEKETKKICKFIGVPWEKNMLDVPWIGSSHFDDHHNATRLSKDVLIQWQKVLTKGEITLCEQMNEKLMKLFSYTFIQDRYFRFGSLLWQIFRYPFHLFGTFLVNPGRVLIQFRAMKMVKKS